MAAWTQSEAIEFCCKVEQICPAYGCHVALTGGALYRSGPRKDVDILFYRIRQVEQIDVAGLIKALGSIGVEVESDQIRGFVVKGHLRADPTKKIDMFFPEAEDGAYLPGEKVPS